MTPFRFFVLLTVCVAWGFHFVVVKTAVTGIPPIFYAFLRMVLVAALLSPLLRWHRGQMVRIAIAGICFGGLNYAFLFSGLKFVPASVGAILVEFYVPAAMLFSVLFLHEQVGWRRIIGAVLAFAGVVTIVSGGDAGLDPEQRLLLGGMLIICGGMSEATGAIFIKKIHGVSALQLLSWFALIGSGLTLVLSLTLESGQFAFLGTPARGGIIAAVLYSAVIASIIGHASYYWLLQRLDVSQVAPAGLMTTVIAVGAGVFLLGETFTFRLAFGALLTMTGVAIIIFRSAQKAIEKEVEPLPVMGPAALRIEEANEMAEMEEDEDDRDDDREVDALYD